MKYAPKIHKKINNNHALAAKDEISQNSAYPYQMRIKSRSSQRQIVYSSDRKEEHQLSKSFYDYSRERKEKVCQALESLIGKLENRSEQKNLGKNELRENECFLNDARKMKIKLETTKDTHLTIAKKDYINHKNFSYTLGEAINEASRLLTTVGIYFLKKSGELLPAKIKSRNSFAECYLKIKKDFNPICLVKDLEYLFKPFTLKSMQNLVSKLQKSEFHNVGFQPISQDGPRKRKLSMEENEEEKDIQEVKSIQKKVRIHLDKRNDHSQTREINFHETKTDHTEEVAYTRKTLTGKNLNLEPWQFEFIKSMLNRENHKKEMNIKRRTVRGRPALNISLPSFRLRNKPNDTRALRYIQQEPISSNKVVDYQKRYGTPSLVMEGHFEADLKNNKNNYLQ